MKPLATTFKPQDHVSPLGGTKIDSSFIGTAEVPYKIRRVFPLNVWCTSVVEDEFPTRMLYRGGKPEIWIGTEPLKVSFDHMLS